MPPVRCKYCKHILKGELSQATGYGPLCYRRIFGRRPKRPGGGKPSRKSRRKRDIAPAAIDGQLTLFDLMERESEDAEEQK